MRKKTEAKRQAILTVAAELFRETGFERASMSELCQRVGGSKATLYNYFSSKEEVFIEVVMQATETEFLATHAALDASVGDIRQVLQMYGERLLALLYSPSVQAVRRLIVAEAGRSELGRKCYEQGPARGMAELAQFLRLAIERGQLRRADPGIMGLHLKSLLEAEWVHHFVFQVGDAFQPARAGDTVKRAIAVFIAAYGTEKVGQSD